MRIQQGERITLRPLTLKERYRFFKWATQSEATPFWYGKRSGDEVPSYIVFKLEWSEHYFTGAEPEKGQCFAIEVCGIPIGQINYNEIQAEDRTTTLDVLIPHSTHQNRGFGTDAIKTLSKYLFQQMLIGRCRVDLEARNTRAIQAFKKAGYQYTHTYEWDKKKWQVMDLYPNAKFPEGEQEIITEVV